MDSIAATKAAQLDAGLRCGAHDLLIAATALAKGFLLQAVLRLAAVLTLRQQSDTGAQFGR